LLSSAARMRVWHTGACGCDRLPGKVRWQLGKLTGRPATAEGAEWPIANGAIGGSQATRQQTGESVVVRGPRSKAKWNNAMLDCGPGRYQTVLSDGSCSS